MRFSTYRSLGLAVILAAFGVAAVAGDQSNARVLRWGSGNGAYLGIEMEDVSADDLAKYKLGRERGIIVRSVVEATPAEEAGLREDDVILEYSGIPVLSTLQFSRLVRETPVGRVVDLTISRDGAEQTLQAKLAKGKGPKIWQGDSNRPVLPREGGREFRFYGPEGFFLDREWSGALVAPTKPRLGVSLQSLTGQMAEFLGVAGKEGVADGKLEAGDVITQADGKAVEDVSDLQHIIRSKKEGDKIDLEVVRDKKEISVSVGFGKKKPGYVM